jgi:transposase-like protein
MDLFEKELISLWDVVCPKCNSEILNKNGKYRGRQRFICLDCGHTFTTYSDTILASTKLNESIWIRIIKSLLKCEKLSTLSNELNISMVTLSKVRKKCLVILYEFNTFDETIRQYYHNPKHNDSIFVEKEKRGTLYFYPLNKNTYIGCIRNRWNHITSHIFTKKEWTSFKCEHNYPGLLCTHIENTKDIEISNYFNNLSKYLKLFRGIKKEDLKYYTNLYDAKKRFTNEEFITYLIQKIKTTKKR